MTTTNHEIMEALALIRETYPNELSAIKVEQSKDGEFHFIAQVGDVIGIPIPEFGFSDDSPKKSVEHLIEKAGTRDIAALTRKQVEELKAQIAKLESGAA
jgi:hypothetical protein